MNPETKDFCQTSAPFRAQRLMSNEWEWCVRDALGYVHAVTDEEDAAHAIADALNEGAK